MHDIHEAITRVNRQRTEHIRQLKEMLEIPSISTLPQHQPDVRRMAAWLAEEMQRIGLTTVEIVDTPGHPAVYGAWLEAAGAPTVLVYGHYDVQPADPFDEWDSDPFIPEVREDYIFARGASDMKGQIFAFLKALEALMAEGRLPVNLKFLFEGEEEIGSPNLGDLIDAHGDRLACDVVLNCDAGIHAPDQPSIVYALRGLAYFEIELRTAVKDLHSGMFGGAVLNPIHVLSELIAGLHDEKGRVTLPGFYDTVRDLDAEERDMLARVPYSDQAFLDMAGAKVLHGEAGYSTTERIGARPALDVNGVWGGFTGEGSKTVLPARAWAKLSTRLVADQDETVIAGQLRAYLEAKMPEGADWELREMVHGPGAIMDRKSAYMQAAVAALRETFGAEPLFKREGGSVPVVGMMQRKLGVDSIMLGFALPGDGIHGPNERQYLPNLFKGMEAYIRFLCGLAVTG